MKRSEMVQFLRDSFIAHMNGECCKTDDEMYSSILGDLENAGMLPPHSLRVGNNWEDDIEW